ncbi:MAG: hypothetical protein Q7S31_03490 [bacterium]|nr:hypothetical protein [bacterium]
MPRISRPTPAIARELKGLKDYETLIIEIQSHLDDKALVEETFATLLSYIQSLMKDLDLEWRVAKDEDSRRGSSWY